MGAKLHSETILFKYSDTRYTLCRALTICIRFEKNYLAKYDNELFRALLGSKANQTLSTAVVPIQ